MRELVKGALPGDRFVFHCKLRGLTPFASPDQLWVVSGHGSQKPNLDGTEKDGMDEGIHHPSSDALSKSFPDVIVSNLARRYPI